MKDYQLTKYNINQVFDELTKALEENPCLVLSVQNAKTGKWGMVKLWRAWMQTTAEYMYKQGCIMPLMIRPNGSSYGLRPFDANDAHELFTAKWLGVDKDGTRLSWSRSGRDGMRPATKGERFLALQRHEEWASTRGLVLINPRDSEYQKLIKESDGGFK